MQTITSKEAVNISPPPPLPLNSQSYSTHYAFLFQMGPFVDAKNDLIEVSLSLVLTSDIGISKIINDKLSSVVCKDKTERIFF